MQNKIISYMNENWHSFKNKTTSVGWNLNDSIMSLLPNISFLTRGKHVEYSIQGERCSSMAEDPLMVQWAVGSILHGGSIGVFLIPASAAQLV